MRSGSSRIRWRKGVSGSSHVASPGVASASSGAIGSSRGGSAIDGRTTRHAGYALSLRARKLIEEAFGWGKDIGLLRRPKFRGRHKMEYAALLTFTGYNLVRMRNLLAPDFR